MSAIAPGWIPISYCEKFRADRPELNGVSESALMLFMWLESHRKAVARGDVDWAGKCLKTLRNQAAFLIGENWGCGC